MTIIENPRLSRTKKKDAKVNHILRDVKGFDIQKGNHFRRRCLLCRRIGTYGWLCLATLVWLVSTVWWQWCGVDSFISSLKHIINIINIKWIYNTYKYKLKPYCFFTVKKIAVWLRKRFILFCIYCHFIFCGFSIFNLKKLKNICNWFIGSWWPTDYK